MMELGFNEYWNTERTFTRPNFVEKPFEWLKRIINAQRWTNKVLSNRHPSKYDR